MIQSKEYEDLVQKIKNVYCNELENENYANKDKLASLFEYWIKLFLLKNYILDKKKLFRYDNRSSIKVKKPYWKDIIQKNISLIPIPYGILSGGFQENNIIEKFIQIVTEIKITLVPVKINERFKSHFFF